MELGWSSVGDWRMMGEMGISLKSGAAGDTVGSVVGGGAEEVVKARDGAILGRGVGAGECRSQLRRRGSGTVLIVLMT